MADTDGDVDMEDFNFVVAGFGQTFLTEGEENTSPVANAGDDINALTSVPVFLNGSDSYDPNDNPIAFSWAMVESPEGSTANLAEPSRPNPHRPLRGICENPVTSLIHRSVTVL